eukprot:GHVU01015157.1.p1 GENE.GHVU01015157.1~~GHVU01015157.1.p1  ORF type:complete len:132 (-),score=10.74 GHVU01015157.1:36-431(-)
MLRRLLLLIAVSSLCSWQSCSALRGGRARGATAGTLKGPAGSDEPLVVQQEEFPLSYHQKMGDVVRRTWAMDYSNYGVCKKVAFEASKTCLVATKDKEPLITDCVNKILKKIDDYSHNECFTMGECVGPLL